MTKMKAGNWYKFNDRGQVVIGQYIGRQGGFECCVCGKGCKAHTFNIWYCENDYETWGFGNNHLPEIIKDNGRVVERCKKSMLFHRMEWLTTYYNNSPDGCIEVIFTIG